MPRSSSAASMVFDVTPVYGLSQTVDRGRATMRSTGRKTFKNDRKQEAIWPEYIEKWLIHGILLYSPPRSRSGRGRGNLQRFPRRNKVISDLIFDRTGKRRTPKQVGSRIQQLRATCRDPNLRLALTDLGRFDEDSESATSASRSPQSTSSTASSVVSHSPEPPALVLDFSSPPPSAISPSPLSSTSPRIVSRSVSIQVVLVDEDWSHRCRDSLNINVDVAEDDSLLMVSPFASDSRPLAISFTTPQSHLYQPPVFIIHSGVADPSCAYETFFEAWIDNRCVSARTVMNWLSTSPCALSSPLCSEIWNEIIASSLHNITVTQTIIPISSDALPQIVVNYGIQIIFDCQPSLNEPPSASTAAVYCAAPQDFNYTFASSPTYGMFSPVVDYFPELPLSTNSAAYALSSLANLQPQPWLPEPSLAPSYPPNPYSL